MSGCQRRDYTFTDIERSEIGDDLLVADHVRSQGDRERGSDFDLFGDLDGIIDLDAEVSNGALDLRMSK